jgi:tetratricopeptide (TPR) repeat protein
MPDDHRAESADEAMMARQAHAALRAGDTARALETWAALRARAPCDEQAMSGMGNALFRLGRMEEAAALAESAAAGGAPGWAAALLARIAERRRDWPASLAHWRDAARHAPDAPEGWIGASQALCRLGRPVEADALLRDGLRRRPGNKALVAAFCRVAETMQDWAEAGRRWTALRDLQPALPDPAAGIARALHGEGRLDAAEAAATAAMRGFPDHAEAHVIYARIAMARPDWREAARRWATVEQRFPMHPAANSVRGPLPATSRRRTSGRSASFPPNRTGRSTAVIPLQCQASSCSSRAWAPTASSGWCSASSAPSRSACCAGQTCSRPG